MLICCYVTHNSSCAIKIKTDFLNKHVFEQKEIDVLNALVYMTQQKWDEAVTLLNPFITANNCKYFLRKYKPQLILADIFLEIEKFEKMNKLLEDFEKHTPNDMECNIQRVKLALAQKNYQKVINLLNKLFNNNYQLMTPSVLSDYIEALTMSVNNEIANLDKIVEFADKR